MTDLTNDDTHDYSPAGKRNRRRRTLLPKRLLRLLILLAVFIILVVVIAMVARSAAISGQAADYQRYMSAVAEILRQSDAMGAELVKNLTTPADTTRKDIQTRLDHYISTSGRLAAQVRDMEVPEDLVDQHVHQFLVVVMSFRHEGLFDLKPSLMTALEVRDLEVSAEQISRALDYLTNSDFLYAEVFVPRAKAVLAANNLEGVSVPSTRFISDPDLASKSRVQEMLTVLKTTESLQAVRGVALSKVVVTPEGEEIKAGGTFNLTSSDELAFQVTVENQGNTTEREVPVKITLISPEPSEPQEVEVFIPEIRPKEEITVTVTGLNPTPYGEVALLKVEAGPVRNERFMDNNSMEASVIFTL